MIKIFSTVLILFFLIKLSIINGSASTSLGKVDAFAVNDSLKTLINKHIENDSDTDFLERLSDWCETKNDSVNIGVVFSEQASALIDSGKDEKALAFCFQAEKYLQNSENHYHIGQTYENMARVNIDMGYENKVIEYTEKAIECYKQLEDSSYLTMAYANLGVSYKTLEQYETALSYYQKSVNLAKAIDDQLCLAKNYMNMANAYDLMGERETAIEYHHRSIEVCREHDIPYGIYLNYINLSEINLQDEKYDEALGFLIEALELANKNGYKNTIPLYENLFYAAKKTGQYKKAIKYFEKAYELKDSVYEAHKHKEIMELQTRYETKKKETEILELKNQKNREAKTRIMLISFLVIAFSVAFFLFFWNRQKSINDLQKNNLLERENQLKTKQLENIRLEKQLKEQELVYQTLKKANVEQINQSIKEKMLPFCTCMRRKKDQAQFSNVLSEITREVSNDPLSDFEQIFIQMHGGFYEKLLKTNSELSSSELQLCALLRMNLPSKEISNILNLSLSTVDQRRHSIRKKLGLLGDQNLVGFLITV